MPSRGHPLGHTVSVNRQQRRQAERQAARNGHGYVRPPELGDQHTSIDLSRTVEIPACQDGAVVVCYLTGGYPVPEFMDSMAEMQSYDFKHNRFLCREGGGRVSMQSGPRVAEGRTQLVTHFLTNPLFEQADWLLMLDDDMVFDADLLARLMAVAHYPDRPIVGGLCFCGRHYGRQWPTIYELYQEEKTFGCRPVLTYPKNALVKVGGTGGACLLVHRQVYVGMAAAPWNKTMPDGRPNPYPWFVEGLVTSDGAPLGEDLAWCRKANLLGIPIHVDTGTKLGHVKPAMLTEATFEAQMADEIAVLEGRVAQGEFEVVESDLWQKADCDCPEPAEANR